MYFPMQESFLLKRIQQRAFALDLQCLLRGRASLPARGRSAMDGAESGARQGCRSPRPRNGEKRSALASCVALPPPSVEARAPAVGGPRTLGEFSFGYFSLLTQRKVTRLGCKPSTFAVSANSKRGLRPQRWSAGRLRKVPACPG